MVRRKDRTTKVIRTSVKTPGGKKKLHVCRKKGKGKAKCALCNAELHGVRQESAKSKKRTTRIFGGHLCHNCVERIITFAARIKQGVLSLESIPISLRAFVEKMVKSL